MESSFKKIKKIDGLDFGITSASKLKFLQMFQGVVCKKFTLRVTTSLLLSNEEISQTKI